MLGWGLEAALGLVFDQLDFLPFVKPTEEVFYLSMSTGCLQLGS